MAYDAKLAGNIRIALARLPDVKEKKMFGGIAFMIGGKMCVTAGADRMMCRIDPDAHKTAIKRKGCRTVIMNGRKYKGYVYVGIDNLQTQSNFDRWINLALDYNRKLRSNTKIITRTKASSPLP